MFSLIKNYKELYCRLPAIGKMTLVIFNVFCIAGIFLGIYIATLIPSIGFIIVLFNIIYLILVTKLLEFC